MNTILVGKRIRDLRKKKGETQEGLASALAVTPQAISKWERGLSFPEISLLPRLADHFGCTVDTLLREEHAPACVPSDDAANELCCLLLNRRFEQAMELAVSLQARGVASAPVLEENVTPEERRIMAKETARFCLYELCMACMREGDCEFELGRFDSSLLAYTYGLRGLESFLMIGEDGKDAYWGEEWITLHWRFHLRRAISYRHLMRQEDCAREIALAERIAALCEREADLAPTALSLTDELRRLGLDNIQSLND